MNKTRKSKPKAKKIDLNDGNGFALLFPTTGHDISDRFVKSMFEMERYDRGKGLNMFSNFISNETGCNIANGRNKLVEYFLDEMPECEWAWFVDTDMVFEPDTPYRLIAAAKASDIPIIGALCVIVKSDSAPLPTLYRDDDETVTQCAVDYPDEPCLLEVAATGTGCLMIHRSVFEKMQADEGGLKTWFHEEHSRISKTGNSFWLGEDISFCLRAREAGFRVAVDCTTHVGHHKGERVWWPEDIREDVAHPTFAVMLEPDFDEMGTVESQGAVSAIFDVYTDDVTAAWQAMNFGVDASLQESPSCNIVLLDRVEFDQMIPAMVNLLRKGPRTTAVMCGEALAVKGEWFNQGWRFTGDLVNGDIVDAIHAAGGIVEILKP